MTKDMAMSEIEQKSVVVVEKDLSVIPEAEIVENPKITYERLMDKFSKSVSLVVGIAIGGIVPWLGLAQFGGRYLGYGCVAFLIFLAISAPILVWRVVELNVFRERNPKIEDFYTQNEIDSFNRKFSVMIVGAVSIIMVGLIVFLMLAITGIFGRESTWPLAIFVLFLAMAVSMFVYAGLQKDKYNIASDKRESTTTGTKAEVDKAERARSMIMVAVTMMFMLIGFVWQMWELAWAAFPLGGILCGVVTVMLNGR